LPVPVYEATPVIYQEKIIIFGGVGSSGVNQNCWNYNFAKNTWDLLTTSKLAHTRYYMLFLKLQQSYSLNMFGKVNWLLNNIRASFFFYF
jgi:hypothetical protein